MEYHQDRFQDYSLMIYNNEELIALLPSNLKGNTLYSHAGLSYGGLIFHSKITFEQAYNAFATLLKYLSENGISSLELKCIPKIYHQLPSDEIDYLLFKIQAQLRRRDLSVVIDTTNRLEMTSNRKRNLKKARSKDVLVKEVSNCSDFFDQILIPNLKERHATLPTHTVAEIQDLKSKFPESIRQFNAYTDDTIIAGVTIFESETVAHAQYISTIDSKKELAGLDVIFDTLLNDVYSDKQYFSFGISNENQGQQINLGLMKWKESFGARAIAHDFYTIDTSKYHLLDNTML